MTIYATRTLDRGRARASLLRQRFAHELRTARIAAGLSQAQLAHRAGYSQAQVSHIERGAVNASLEALARIASAAGGELGVKIHPGEGVRLRDSGQLDVARLIAGEAHGSWRVSLEVPVGRPPDRRAADMVMDDDTSAVLIEIERGLADFQAQSRAAQLKRVALSERMGRRVHLVLALLDTDSIRRAVAQHREVIRTAFPIPSRAIWAAIRSGGPLAGDGILWVRVRDLRRGRTNVR